MLNADVMKIYRTAYSCLEHTITILIGWTELTKESSAIYFLLINKRKKREKKHRLITIINHYVNAIQFIWTIHFISSSSIVSSSILYGHVKLVPCRFNIDFPSLMTKLYVNQLTMEKSLVP